LKFLRLAGKSCIDFFRDDGLTLAASISYFSMMALVPFCLLLITLFGHLLGNYPDFYSFFLNRLASLFPSAADDISKDVIGLLSHKGLGKVSLVLYGILSFQVYASIENSLDRIFKVKKGRTFLCSVVVSVVVTTLVIVLIMVSFAAASFVPVITVLKPYLPGVRISGVTGFLIRFVIPSAMMLFAITAAYRIIPRAKIKLRDAFIGGCFTTVFLEIAKYLFTWYVEDIARLGRVYGPLTAVIVFLLWMFYSSSLFLIGAEIVYNSGRTRKA